MGYLLLANPREWEYGNPHKFDELKKVNYKIHLKNEKYLRNAKPGDRALLLITAGSHEIKFEAKVTREPHYEGSDKVVEFSCIKKINPLRVEILKWNPKISEIIFAKNGSIKLNSVLPLEDWMIDEIIDLASQEGDFFYGDEFSRKYFEKMLWKQVKYYVHADIAFDSNQIINVKYLNKLRYIDKDCIMRDEEKVGCISDILNKYDFKQMMEDVNLELIACYRAYHIHNNKYGIYFNVGKFANYILSTIKLLNTRNYSLDFKTIRNICFEEVLQHERFHYLIELFITLWECSLGKYNIYDNYKYIYRRTFLTDKCLGEALANYFSKMHFLCKGKKKYADVLNIMFRAQLPGYRLAASINKNNELSMFNEFEQQILQQAGRGSMLREVKELYLKDRITLAQLEVNDKLNIPVYLVNDGLSDNDFESLLSVIFPNLI